MGKVKNRIGNDVRSSATEEQGEAKEGTGYATHCLGIAKPGGTWLRMCKAWRGKGVARQ